MTTPSATLTPLAERVHAEFDLIKSSVAGVYGCVVATSDGFLVAHDVPDLEPTEVAALAATTRALASRTTLATGRGEFMETMTRGAHGYMITFAAGPHAILAVIGTDDLNLGMLRYQTRQVITRIAANSPEFRTWSSTSGGQPVPSAADEREADGPPPLPRRRPR